MKIAVTGGTGLVGRMITEIALSEGHSVVNVDRIRPSMEVESVGKVQFVQADITSYEVLASAFAGCDAVIHLAAVFDLKNQSAHFIHNTNVVGSYNALGAAIENGITRICQASSINAIGHAYSRHPRYDYFPIDEDHPTYTEDPYSLSKWICEQQADSFSRRHGGTSIASMRFHWVKPDRGEAVEGYEDVNWNVRNHLWAYTRIDAAAMACLKSIAIDLGGHEVFNIVAPDTASDMPSRALAERHFPDVPLKGTLAGRTSFISSAKAERMLGWVHPGTPREEPGQKPSYRSR